MQVGGPPTNIDFLQKLTKHPAFVAAEVDTGFIERHAEDLLAVNPVSTRGVAVAVRSPYLSVFSPFFSFCPFTGLFFFSFFFSFLQ